jgi:hypothetical protein
MGIDLPFFTCSKSARLTRLDDAIFCIVALEKLGESLARQRRIGAPGAPALERCVAVPPIVTRCGSCPETQPRSEAEPAATIGI